MSRAQDQGNMLGTMPVKRLVLAMSAPIMVSMLMSARLQPGGQHLCGPGERPGLSGPQLRLPGAADDGGLLHRHWGGFQRHLRPASGGGEGGRRPTGWPVTASSSIPCAGCCFWPSPCLGHPCSSGCPPMTRWWPQAGVQYLTICCGASIGMCMQFLTERLLQTTGHPTGFMIVQGSGAVLNIILDPVFIFRPGHGGGASGGGHGDRADLRGLHRLFPAVAHPPGVLHLLSGLPAQRGALRGDAAHRRPRHRHAVPVQLHVSGTQPTAHLVVPDGGVRAGSLLQDPDLCLYAHLWDQQRPHPHSQL